MLSWFLNRDLGRVSTALVLLPFCWCSSTDSAPLEEFLPFFLNLFITVEKTKVCRMRQQTKREVVCVCFEL